MLHYLLKEMAETRRQNTALQKLVNRLYSLDVHQNADSVEAIFAVAFRNFDLEPGPPNEFLTEEVDLRREFIMQWRAFHAGQGQPLDELAKDVVRVGIPDVLRFDDTSLDAYYPNISLTRHYERDIIGVYIASGMPIERDIMGNPISIAPIVGRIPSNPFKDEMELIKDRVYGTVHYALLENVIMRPFAFPSRCTGDWDGVSPYGAAPWPCMRAGIDVFGMLKNVVSENPDGSRLLDLSVKYIITEPMTGDTAASDSLSYSLEIPDTSQSDGFTIRIYSEPFHAVDSGLDPGSTTYLLDVAVYSAGENEGNGMADLKAASEVFSFSLPGDSGHIPMYDLMLAEKDRKQQRTYLNPFAGILSFHPDSTVKRKDTVDLWLPVTGLTYAARTESYEGFIDILLTAKGSGKVTAGINKESMRFGKPGDTLNPSVDYSLPSGDTKDSPSPIHVEKIISTTPNLYYHLQVPIPAKAPKGDMLLSAFAYGYDERAGQLRAIATASKDVLVK